MNKEQIKLKKKEIEEELFLMSLLLKREDVSKTKKFLIFLAISYAVSPIDFLPDIIPFYGYLDDILIIPFFLKLAMHHLNPQIIIEAKEEMKNYENKSIKVKWYYGIFTAAVFVLAVVLLMLLIPTKNIEVYR